MATSLSFHHTTLSPIIAGLKNAKAWIAKGQQHAQSQGIDPNDYLTARLYPDMYDFIEQVQRFTDAAKFLPPRVNPAIPAITLPDVEKTFPELLDRVQRTLDYVESIDAKAFEGREDAELVLPFRNGTLQVTYSVAEYVVLFAHPNFWYVEPFLLFLSIFLQEVDLLTARRFHSTTAYGILRSKGVPLGKMDFLNGAGLKEIQVVEKKEGE